MSAVRFHDEARAELVHEVTFYATVSRRLGERFDKAVNVVHLAMEAEIFIMAISPDSKRPGYWRSRVIDAV